MVGPKTQKNTPARQAAQAKYNSKPAQVKRRASRNAARRELMKEGVVRKGDGVDVAHKNNNPLQNSRSNITPQSKAKNRSVPRDKAGKRK